MVLVVLSIWLDGGYCHSWLTRVAAADEPVLLTCAELTESSGVAASLNEPGLIWTHNDSGGKPRLYLFRSDTGKLRSVYEIPQAANVDWEDICSFKFGDTNFLAIADVGDNQKQRPFVELILLKEPSIESEKLGSVADPTPLAIHATIRVRYPNGPFDCEGLAFDSKFERFILVTKELVVTRIMEVKLDKRISSTLPSKTAIQYDAKLVQGISLGMITGADICQATRQLILCNYGAGYVLEPQSEGSQKWNGSKARRIELPKRQQGEAIAFAGVDRLLLTSEGSPTPLWNLELTRD